MYYQPFILFGKKLFFMYVKLMDSSMCECLECLTFDHLKVQLNHGHESQFPYG